MFPRPDELEELVALGGIRGIDDAAPERPAREQPHGARAQRIRGAVDEVASGPHPTAPVDRAPDDDGVVRSDGLDVLGIDDVDLDAGLTDGLADRAGDLPRAAVLR